MPNWMPKQRIPWWELRRQHVSLQSLNLESLDTFSEMDKWTLVQWKFFIHIKLSILLNFKLNPNWVNKKSMKKENCTKLSSSAFWKPWQTYIHSMNFIRNQLKIWKHCYIKNIATSSHGMMELRYIDWNWLRKQFILVHYIFSKIIHFLLVQENFSKWDI